MTTKATNTFSITPSLAMVFISNFSVEYAMALGAVATGNMNENDVETATGNMRYSGLIPSFSDCKCVTFNSKLPRNAIS